MQLPVSWAAPASTRALVQKVLRISWDLQKHYLFANNPSNIRANMKSQIKNKNQSFNCGITNTNIKWNYYVSILTCFSLKEGKNHEQS